MVTLYVEVILWYEITLADRPFRDYLKNVFYEDLNSAFSLIKLISSDFISGLYCINSATLPKLSHFWRFVVVVEQNVRTLDVSVYHRFRLSVQKVDPLRDSRQDPHPLLRF